MSSTTPAPTLPGPTANERMKRRFGSVLSGSIIVSTLLHLAVFVAWPTMSVQAGEVSDDVVHFEPPPEAPLPDEPPPIAAPPVPVISTDVPDDVTLQPFDPVRDFDRFVPPPPDDEVGRFRAVTPTMVRPGLRNLDEVRAATLREYPDALRDHGIGGVVVLRLWIDEQGRVVRSEVARSSGFDRLDAAALRVVPAMRFRPAIYRDRSVAVVAELPLAFEVLR